MTPDKKKSDKIKKSSSKHNSILDDDLLDPNVFKIQSKENFSLELQKLLDEF